MVYSDQQTKAAKTTLSRTYCATMLSDMPVGSPNAPMRCHTGVSFFAIYKMLWRHEKLAREVSRRRPKHWRKLPSLPGAALGLTGGLDDDAFAGKDGAARIAVARQSSRNAVAPLAQVHLFVARPGSAVSKHLACSADKPRCCWCRLKSTALLVEVLLAQSWCSHDTSDDDS
jgi:hypothetical protein